MRPLGLQRGTGDVSRHCHTMITRLDLKKKPGAEVAKQIIKLFDRSKEKLGRYLEELLSEKGGWGLTEGPAGMQIGSSREFCQGCSRRTLHSSCTRTLPVFPSMTSSSTRPAPNMSCRTRDK